MAKIRVTKQTILEFTFWALWILYSFAYVMFSLSNYSRNHNTKFIYALITNFTIVALLALFLFVRKYSLKKFVMCAVFLMILFWIEIAAPDKQFLVGTLFIVVAQNIDVQKGLKLDIKLKTILTLGVILLCSLGVIENYAVVSNGIYKQSLGFSNPNVLTCYALAILAEWLCLNYGKMKKWQWVAVALIWYLINEVGGGRSSSYTFLVILVLFWLANYFPKIFYGKISQLLFGVITPCMAILSFVLVYFYNRGNLFVIALNQIMTGRIRMSSYFLSTYGIKPFGQQIVTVSSRRAATQNIAAMIVDNAYVKCILVYGWIFLVFICAVYAILFLKLIRDKRIEIALLALFFVVLGLGEVYMLNAMFNYSMLFLLSNNHKKKQQKLQGEFIDESIGKCNNNDT